MYLAIRLVRDGNECDLFDLHQKFRLTHKQAFDAVKQLSELDILRFNGKEFSLKGNITREKLSVIYKMLLQRNLNLDNEDLLKYKKNSLNPYVLYKPNFSRLDPLLLVDE